MSIEVHIDWQGDTHLVGNLFPAQRGTTVSFEYSPHWLRRAGRFAIDPTSLPLRPGMQHSATLFGAMQDCGPDRWGRLLIERAVRKKVLDQKPYREIDYVLALDDNSRIGALRFRADPGEPFLASSTGVIPPIVRLKVLLRAADAIHSETETAQDLRFLLGEGSPLGSDCESKPPSSTRMPALSRTPTWRKWRGSAGRDVRLSRVGLMSVDWWPCGGPSKIKTQHSAFVNESHIFHRSRTAGPVVPGQDLRYKFKI